MGINHKTHFVRTETVSWTQYTQNDPDTVQYDASGEAITATLATATDIEANCQPATGEQLLRLPEGRRTKETLNIWTLTPISEQDIIVRNNKTYEIDHVNDWQSPSSTLPHYHGMMTRRGDR